VRKITVGFSTSNKRLPIFCWAIQWAQGTKFSHVYVKSMTKYGIDLIYQASGSQVNFISGVEFLKINKPVLEVEFEVSDESYDKYMKFALSNVGKPYGVAHILGLALMHFFGLKHNIFSDGKAKYVCSELVADILNELGLDDAPKEYLENSTPLDIWNLIKGKFKGDLHA
jgi:hypothetical protein